jgi:hypothetical protein
MCPYNNISENLSTGDYNQIINRINAIKAALPFLVNLTADERRSGLKMGDKSLAFVSKCLEYASAHPNLVPPYLNVAEFQKDHDLREQLLHIIRELNTLVEAVDDTILALGKEEFEQALIFYNSVKQAAKGNVPGTGAIVEDLAERFPGNSSSADNGDGTTPEPPAPSS